MKNTAILYAVLDTPKGMRKVRLSDALPDRVAFDLFEAVETDHRPTQQRRDSIGRYAPKNRLRQIVGPGYTVVNQPVRFFALRSPQDPDWPATAPKMILRDMHGIYTA